MSNYLSSVPPLPCDDFYNFASNLPTINQALLANVICDNMPGSFWQDSTFCVSEVADDNHNDMTGRGHNDPGKVRPRCCIFSRRHECLRALPTLSDHAPLELELWLEC